MPLIHTLKFIANHPLNSADRVGAFVRYLKWQVGSRLVPGPVICDWINGAKFSVRKGEIGMTGNIYGGLAEFVDMAYMIHALTPHDLFADVGANAGAYTILASMAAGARAIAFEPVPSTYERLTLNIRINQLEARVRCLNVGLGAEEGNIAFTSDLDDMNRVVIEGDDTGRTITGQLLTLDSVLGDDPPSVMKIDVEGYEKLVLQGAEQTLRSPALHSVIMELNDQGKRYGFDESTIITTMKEHGFGMFEYDAMNRTLSALAEPNRESRNTLFVRNTETILERIRNAPRFTYRGVHV